MKPLAALLDIAAALVLFALASLAVAAGAVLLPPGARVPAVIAGQGMLLLGGVGLLLAWRRRRWADIGLVAFKARDLARGALALGACLGANLLLVYCLYLVAPETVAQHSERLGGLAQRLTAGLPLPWLLILLGFVGLYEEVFARGFLLARCRSLLGGVWAPVALSALLFGLGHLYQGWLGVAQTALVGVVLARCTLGWGSLWPAIVAHALLDIGAVTVMGELARGNAS